MSQFRLRDYISDDKLDDWYSSGHNYEDEVDENGFIIPDYDEPDYVKEGERGW